ncbi:ArsC/Spx/MgsR family protein [Mariniluteicoccus endophyticus]
MADITVLHNPRCSTSRAALGAAEAAGVEVDVRNYLVDPLTRDELVDLLGKLEDSPTDLVRRDTTFTALGLSDADVETADQVADVVAANPKVMQRPILVRGDRAIIGRPKDRVPGFIA